MWWEPFYSYSDFSDCRLTRNWPQISAGWSEATQVWYSFAATLKVVRVSDCTSGARGRRVGVAGVVLPLARLEAALDVDELTLGQELARDLGQPVPGHARVVFRPLAVAAAVLVRRDREGRQVPSLPNP